MSSILNISTTQLMPVDVAFTITDDELVKGASVAVVWPSADERYNACTVTYNNEAENFQQDSVTWPPRKSGTFDEGFGGTVYPIVSGWDQGYAGGALLNSVGVWDGSGVTTDCSWKFRVLNGGNHVFRFAADDNGTLYVNGNVVGTVNGWTNVSEVTINLAENSICTVRITANDTNPAGDGNLKGIAGTCRDPSGLEIWNTKAYAYTDILVKTYSDALYQAFLEEDGGVRLETSVSDESIIDYYHALAKAEETVRTSRTAAKISFQYVIKDKYVSPGDIIRLESERLNLGIDSELLIRVEDVKVNKGLVCEVTGYRFHWTQLAWNVKDDQFILPPKQYNNTLYPPAWVSFVVDGVFKGYNGYVDFPKSMSDGVNEYAVFAHKMGDYDENNQQIFTEIGRTTSAPFYVNVPAYASMLFGVRSISGTRKSEMRVSSLNTYVNNVKIETSGPLNLTATSSTKSAAITLKWDIPTEDTYGKPYTSHNTCIIWRGTTNDKSQATKIGETIYGPFVDKDESYVGVYYWVDIVTQSGGVNGNTTPVSTNFNHFGGAVIGDVAPPSPINLTVTPAYATMFLDWDITAYVGAGTTGGHSHCELYAAKKTGTSEPTISSATLVAKVYAHSYQFTANEGETWYFWVYNVAKNGVRSNLPAGEVHATAYMNSTLLLQTLNGSITMNELASDVKAPINNSVTRLNALETWSSGADTTITSLTNSLASTNQSVTALSKLTAGPDGDTAQYTLKVNSNGRVAGFGLSSKSNSADGTTTAMVVVADKFGIASSDDSVSGSPFYVITTPTTLDGVSIPVGVYMDAAFIRAASITNAHIKELNADKINAGTLSAARIGANSITTDKLQVGSVTSNLAYKSTTNTTFYRNTGVNSGADSSVVTMNNLLASSKVVISASALGRCMGWNLNRAVIILNVRARFRDASTGVWTASGTSATAYSDWTLVTTFATYEMNMADAAYVSIMGHKKMFNTAISNTVSINPSALAGKTVDQMQVVIQLVVYGYTDGVWSTSGNFYGNLNNNEYPEFWGDFAITLMEFRV